MDDMRGTTINGRIRHGANGFGDDANLRNVSAANNNQNNNNNNQVTRLAARFDTA